MLNTILIILGITILITGLTIWYIKRTIDKLLDINTSELDNYYTELEVEYEGITHDEIIKKIIKRESLKTGVFGFVTGLFGVFAMPITLPIDLLCSMAIQYRLVKFISKQDEVDCEMATMMVGAGNQLWKHISKTVITKVATKSIPILGAVVGGIVDGLFTYTTGTYQHKLSKR